MVSTSEDVPSPSTEIEGAEELTPASGLAYEPMSVRGPALIVLGLAVFLLIGGVISSAISSGSNPSFTIRKVTLVDGTNVALAPATRKLHAIVSNGEPPADVIGNLGVPKRSTVGAVVNSDQRRAQFNRTVSLTSLLTQSQVIETYTKMFRAAGWQVIYSGPAPQSDPGSTEVLAKLGSSDGFYWETGVVVSPTTETGTTPYTLDLFETPDGD